MIKIIFDEKLFKGIPASPGISISKAYLYKKTSININYDILREDELVSEIEELINAIEISKRELNKIYELSVLKIGEENSRIFEAQISILNDKIFINSTIDRIRKEKRSASYIFNEEINKMGSMMLASNDEYMKERFLDVEDTKNRVIRNMKREKLFSKVEENSIIVAHQLTPADTILFNKRNVQGYITDTGGATSHAAIISRALRVPAVVGMKDISKNITTGEIIIIDGFEGIVITNPTDSSIDSYKKRMKKIKIEEEKLYDLKDLPCETIDNKKIVLTANIELDQEIDFTKDCGLEGIGLYRTEYLFLEKGNFPSEIEQIEEYTKISEVVEPNIVTIRTYDIGGDKVLPTSQKEDNPFLGWRGIRICLDKVNIFKEQLRAILVSSVRKNVRIMLPMISSLCEVRQSKKVLSEVKNELRDNKIPFDDNIKLGIMIEVPSACLLAEELAKEVDFFSIGTNDLIQYTLAVDRGNELISGMFREFHPAVLRMMKMVVDAAHKNNIKVSICGEMASISVAAPVLVGLGIDELSIIPSSFLEIKKIIRSMKYVEAKNLTEEILKMNTTDDVEKRIMEFFEKNLILNTN